MEYEMNRNPSRSGKKAVFFVTINGKRIGRTNWARKYDAKGELTGLISRMGVEKLTEWSVK